MAKAGPGEKGRLSTTMSVKTSQPSIETGDAKGKDGKKDKKEKRRESSGGDGKKTKKARKA